MMALGGDEALNRARANERLWALMLEKEEQWSKLSGTLDCGANIIYVVEKVSESNSA